MRVRFILEKGYSAIATTGSHTFEELPKEVTRLLVRFESGQCASIYRDREGIDWERVASNKKSF